MVLKALVGATCLAVLAFVGFFFFEREIARRAVLEEANRRLQYSQCTEEQKESARAYAIHGGNAVNYGYPNAEEYYPDCLPPTL